MQIAHHDDCTSWEDDNFCDCDFWDKLELEQVKHDKARHGMRVGSKSVFVIQ